MQLGMIGLGRMGANIALRVANAGHECVVYDHNPDAVKAMAGEERTTGVFSLEELAEKMTTPRVPRINTCGGMTRPQTAQPPSQGGTERAHALARRKHRARTD